MKNEELWNGPIHKAFVDSLSTRQLAALWELVLVATLADDELSVEERRDLALSLGSTPAFEPIGNLSITATAELERLFVAYESDAAYLLNDIADRLGDGLARRGAFRTAVQLVKSDGLVQDEIDFIKNLGELLGLEPEVVDFALSGAP